MKTSLLIFALAAFSFTARAENLEELNPFDPNVEETLKKWDAEYERATGQSPFVDDLWDFEPHGGCYRLSCTVYAQVIKSTQRLYLYVNGRLEGEFPVSTGVRGYDTPDMDTHPNGRIYDRYTSTKYPEGDYNGLGNMPYAVFIRGGFAIHGTPRGNWPRLGTKASHGCIRVHPDNGYRFNRLVRAYGIRNTWVTID